MQGSMLITPIKSYTPNVTIIFNFQMYKVVV